MDVASPTNPPAASPPPPVTSAVVPAPPAVLHAWPRSAQLATAFLLGVSTTLLLVHILGSARWGSRPASLERPIVGYRIDLNRAARAELLQIPGVGPSLADRIEEHRRERGPFMSVDELVEVRGIGPSTLARIRPWLTVHEEDSIAETETDTAPAQRKPSSAPMEGDERKSGVKKDAKLAGPIDINRASTEELQKLSGIGPKLSQRIVDERAKRPFKSVDDLRRVSGIGPKTLERLRPNITVGDSQKVGTDEELR